MATKNRGHRKTIQLTRSNEPVSSKMADKKENCTERRNEDDMSGPSGPMENSTSSYPSK
jgi:hypothetical protein